MMSEPTKVLIADDHALLRGGLRQVIEAERSFSVVGEAADGETALRLIGELAPEIAVLDINMPGLSGFAVINEICRRSLPTKVVVLTMHSEEAMFSKAMSLGVRGYVLKDSAAADIINCLHAVRRGQSFTSPAVTSYLFKRAGNIRPVKGIGALTPTERLVLRLISEGKTSREIASELGISHRTVENHRNNISGKLDVSGSHALIKYALQHLEEI
jgi:DNA-binding NarL/FixJ family response regulator